MREGTKGHSWEFPVFAHYRFGHERFRPYGGAGLGIRKEIYAKTEIETYYSEASIGGLVDQRLRVIGARERFSALKHEIFASKTDLDSFLMDFQDVSAYVPADFFLYQRLLDEIKNIACGIIPAGATTAVVSKGDCELLKLGPHQAWHFPRAESGVYAGHYPADSVAAIEHLETLHAMGADYLLFPATAFWWLEQYPEFGRHLDVNYRRVWDDRYCRIYHLRSAISPIEETKCFTVLSYQLQDLSKNEIELRAKLLALHRQRT